MRVPPTASRSLARIRGSAVRSSRSSSTFLPRVLAAVLRPESAVFLFAAQGLNVALTFAAYALISRRLGSVEAVGEFGLARSITLALSYAADSAIRLGYIHASASRGENADALARTAQTLQLLLAAAAMPILGLVILAGGWTSIGASVVAAGLVAVTQYGSDIAAAELLARRRKDLAGAALAADRVLMLACVGTALAISPSVVSAYAGMLAANVLRAGGCLVLARRALGISCLPGWSSSIAKDLVRRGAPVGLSLMAFAVQGRMSVFALDKLGSDAAGLGLWTAAVTMIGLLNFLPTTFGLSELPHFGPEEGEWLDGARAVHRRCYRRVMLAAFAAATTLIAAAGPSLSLLFGPRFIAAAPLLQIAALSLPFGFMSHVYRYLLIPVSARWLELGTTLAGIALQAVLAALWIPHYQAAGAAAALLAGEVAVFAGKFLIASRRLGGVTILRGCGVPLAWLACQLSLMSIPADSETTGNVMAVAIGLAAALACVTRSRNVPLRASLRTPA